MRRFWQKCTKIKFEKEGFEVYLAFTSNEGLNLAKKGKTRFNFIGYIAAWKRWNLLP